MPALVPDMPHPTPLLPHQGLWPGQLHGSGTSTTAAAAAATVGLGSPPSGRKRLGFAPAGAAARRALSAFSPKKLINSFASNNMGRTTAPAVPPAEASGLAHRPVVPWGLGGQAAETMAGDTLAAAALGPAAMTAADSSRRPLATHLQPGAAAASIAATGSGAVASAAGVQPDGGSAVQRNGGAAGGAPRNNAARAAAAGGSSSNPRRQNQCGECKAHGLMVLAKAPAADHHKECWRATGDHTFKQGAKVGKAAVSFKGKKK